jgi:hypothetical protein
MLPSGVRDAQELHLGPAGLRQGCPIPHGPQGRHVFMDCSAPEIADRPGGGQVLEAVRAGTPVPNGP